MAAPSHVIELASPAYIRARYVRRIGKDGGLTVTTNTRHARRFEPIEAAKALRTLQAVIERTGFVPSVVPAAALELQA